MSLPITDLVAGIFKPAVDLIDELHTSDEEKLNAKAALIAAEASAVQTAINYERGVLEAQSKVIQSESSSKHWLTSNWRPLTMITFLILIVNDSYGWLPNPLSEQAWLAINLGLGGYVAGRSAEKIVKTVKK